MHELSIVMNIIDIARLELEKSQLKEVESIVLEIGELSGVELEAFDFAWQMSVNNTILEKTKRKIVRIEARARCEKCDQIFKTDSYYQPCPECNEFYFELISGKELRVKSLIVA